MKIIMLSQDEYVFKSDSSFRERLRLYAVPFEEIHVIVPTADRNQNTDSFGKVYLWPIRKYPRILYPWFAYRQAKSLIKQDPKEFLVSSQEAFGGLVGYLLKLRFRTPWQAQIHTDIASPYFRNFSLKNKLRFFLDKRLLPKTSCIRVVSVRLLKSITSLIGSETPPISILPVYSERRLGKEHSYEDPLFDFVFLMVSRLTPEKNVELAFRAFSRMLKDFPQTTLRIVGDGILIEALKTLAQSLEIEDHVQFMGWQRDPTPYYENSNAFLLTSWYEGFGVSVVEALSQGLPIVMTDVGVAGELVEDGVSGIVVRPGDEDALLEAMKRIRSDGNLRERLGKQALLVAKNLPDKEMYMVMYKNSYALCKK